MDLLMRRGHDVVGSRRRAAMAMGAVDHQRDTFFGALLCHSRDTDVGDQNRPDKRAREVDITYFLDNKFRKQGPTGQANGHTEEKDTVPHCAASPQDGHRSVILHDMARRAQPVLWEVDRRREWWTERRADATPRTSGAD
jgi:hypothetical protein